eukprot:TRINITY_DN63711_c0_g1_i1.p1 TRINITY_DN63711_c0_g1~~TRINITY_DN63711_c0_g1_i1.p1  ORF type:complete len:565 (+),score=96.68 TRINITY_DN63711_c0_g1_i1:24-1718(+)
MSHSHSGTRVYARRPLPPPTNRQKKEQRVMRTYVQTEIGLFDAKRKEYEERKKHTTANPLLAQPEKKMRWARTDGLVLLDGITALDSSSYAPSSQTNTTAISPVVSLSLPAALTVGIKYPQQQQSHHQHQQGSSSDCGSGGGGGYVVDPESVIDTDNFTHVFNQLLSLRRLKQLINNHNIPQNLLRQVLTAINTANVNEPTSTNNAGSSSSSGGGNGSAGGYIWLPTFIKAVRNVPTTCFNTNNNQKASNNSTTSNTPAVFISSYPKSRNPTNNPWELLFLAFDPNLSSHIALVGLTTSLQWCLGCPVLGLTTTTGAATSSSLTSSSSCYCCSSPLLQQQQDSSSRHRPFHPLWFVRACLSTLSMKFSFIRTAEVHALVDALGRELQEMIDPLTDGYLYHNTTNLLTSSRSTTTQPRLLPPLDNPAAMSSSLSPSSSSSPSCSSSYSPHRHHHGSLSRGITNTNNAYYPHHPHPPQQQRAAATVAPVVVQEIEEYVNAEDDDDQLVMETRQVLAELQAVTNYFNNHEKIDFLSFLRAVGTSELLTALLAPALTYHPKPVGPQLN